MVPFSVDLKYQGVSEGIHRTGKRWMWGDWKKKDPDGWLGPSAQWQQWESDACHWRNDQHGCPGAKKHMAYNDHFSEVAKGWIVHFIEEEMGLQIGEDLCLVI